MSFGTAEAIQLAQLAAGVIPDLVQTFASLLGSGHSKTEALAIVRRDIKSRRLEYERMKAEDHEALRRKHGFGDPDRDTPPQGVLTDPEPE